MKGSDGLPAAGKPRKRRTTGLTVGAILTDEDVRAAYARTAGDLPDTVTLICVVRMGDGTIRCRVSSDDIVELLGLLSLAAVKLTEPYRETPGDCEDGC